MKIPCGFTSLVQALVLQRNTYQPRRPQRVRPSESTILESDRGLGRHRMQCPLCGREMTTLGQSDQRKVSQPVYYCEKHGVLNRTVDTRDRISEIAKHPARPRSD